MNYTDAMDIIGGLSNPSKMPWYSWSISAQKCHTGSKLRKVEGSVCADCYACKGFYPLPSVQKAMDRRYDSLYHPKFVEAFVLVLKTLHRRGRKTRKLADGRVIGENRFRWHDSGDLQDHEHLRRIVTIADLCPELEFYLPTKEAKLVGSYEGTIPPNLHIKLSHPMVGRTFSKRPNGLSFTTVGRDDDPKLFQCPAKRYQGNKCLDCDKCWTETDINYPLH